jgi:murein DD-endopeptidase MepM/ murein hydrolase activator NlpD
VVTVSSTSVYGYQEVVKPVVWVEKWLSVDVTESLYVDMLKAGYSNGFVASLIGEGISDNIFAWKIDFFTEQRPGDRLEVLYEQQYIIEDGKQVPVNNVRVLAASYVGKATKRKENHAYRYQSGDATKPDYYDEEGNALRKAFLRAPFTHRAFRLSSGFSSRRFHPILRVYRPHHGIDYAASYGTPAASIGKGKVIYTGWKSGFGNTVEIRHNGTFVSRYGHLSSIAVKLGQSVEQGQMVGRVGNTGLSTGPHLHFEMLVNGSQRNFLNLDFPSASAVDPKYLSDFKQTRDNLQARLTSGDKAVQEAKKTN